MRTKCFVAAGLLSLSACVTSPPRNTANICSIFREKSDWYEDARESYSRWGVPIHIQMAIMHQESRFVADVRPPRPRVLGVIPWFRDSSAYGYSQAQDGTWQEYLDQVDNWGADRDDFADSADFIGWYCAQSHKKLGISKWNARQLYLAYHEGHAGYRRKTYAGKRWLLKTASKVAKIARTFQAQLVSCQKELESSGWFFW